MKKKILLGICSTGILLSACSNLSGFSSKQTYYDTVSRPQESGEPDYESITSYSEIKSRFEVRTSEIENQEYINKIKTYSVEEKNKLLKDLSKHIGEFRSGGTVYKLDEALDIYKTALILSYTSDDKDDDYHYIGFQTYHSILKIYGAEFVEGGANMATLGVKQACLRLQELGYLDDDYNPTN